MQYKQTKKQGTRTISWRGEYLWG